ncbi:MAG: hypothetical protein P8X74_19785 [Reinekea sp.]
MDRNLAVERSGHVRNVGDAFGVSGTSCLRLAKAYREKNDGDDPACDQRIHPAALAQPEAVDPAAGALVLRLSVIKNRKPVAMMQWAFCVFGVWEIEPK